MKTKKINSVVIVLAGLVLALGIFTLFHPCNSGKKMACYYAGRIEISTGILIAVLGIISFFFNEKNRAGFFVSVSLLGLFSALVPVYITGVCKMASMHCRKATYPFSVVTGILIFILALLFAINSIRKNKD